MQETTIANDPAAMKKIKTLSDERRKLGLTQQQLAEKFNICRSIISQYEVGTRIPIVPYYNKLADFFHWPHYSAPDETVPIDFSEDTPKSKSALSSALNVLLDDVKTIATIENCNAEEILTALLSRALKPYRDALATLRRLRNDIQKEDNE